MDRNIPTIRMNNGCHIPAIGLGVYQISDVETERVILDAIKVGYRLFDTAEHYKNEAGVGSAIRQSRIPPRGFFHHDKNLVQGL